jgi:hypothetical protein
VTTPDFASNGMSRQIFRGLIAGLVLSVLISALVFALSAGNQLKAE